MIGPGGISRTRQECKRSLEAELKMQGIDPQELLHKFHISLLSATGPRLDRVREIYPDPCTLAAQMLA